VIRDDLDVAIVFDDDCHCPATVQALEREI
jgi:hypothetical protein